MSTPSPEAYQVHCFNCQSRFDPLESAWCNCLVAKRSFICPSCLNCFCKAPPAYKQKFWEAAPKALWERSEAEHSGKFDPPENPAPDHGGSRRATRPRENSGRPGRAARGP